MTDTAPSIAATDPDLAGLVDQARYPIHLLGTGNGVIDGLVDTYRTAMADNGVAVLPGFVPATTMTAIEAEAERLRPLGHFSETFSSPYLSTPDPTLPATDPRSFSQRAALSAIAFDEFEPSSPLVRLYESVPLRAFLAAVLDVDELHSYADPLGAMSVAAMGAGDELGWHFDFSQFVVSLGIRSSLRGGTFDVVPQLRSEIDANEAGVVSVLNGEHDGVVTLPLEPGTLMIFAGRHSLHSVSPIEGDVERLVGLLSYDTKPGTDSTDLLKLIRYGRTTARGGAS